MKRRGILRALLAFLALLGPTLHRLAWTLFFVILTAFVVILLPLSIRRLRAAGYPDWLMTGALTLLGIVGLVVYVAGLLARE